MKHMSTAHIPLYDDALIMKFPGITTRLTDDTREERLGCLEALQDLSSPCYFLMDWTFDMSCGVPRKSLFIAGTLPR